MYRPLVVPMEPVATPRPRVTRYGTYYTKRYTKYKRELSLILANVQPTDELQITFYFRRPKNKKSGVIYRHQKKPDIDNLIKGIMDCLPFDDKMIYKISAEKYYCRTGGIPRIEINVRQQNNNNKGE